MKFFRETHGFTLIETVLYAGLAGLVILAILSFTVLTFRAFERLRLVREGVESGRVVLDTVLGEVRAASRIYAPTSKFDVPLGQLSLRTRWEVTGSEGETYRDFYVDGGRLWEKREGESPFPLTGENIRASEFSLEDLQATTTPVSMPLSVRVTLTLEPTNTKANPVIFTGSATTRSAP